MAEQTPIPRSALIVVDVQEDFCEPHGSLAVKGGRELVTIWNTLLRLPFALKIASKDWHPADHVSFASQHSGAEPFTSDHTIVNPENADEPFKTTLWPDHCIQDTKGAELIHELDQSRLDHVVKKGMDARLESYSAFGPAYRNPSVGLTELGDLLRKEKITHVFVVGLAYGFCVKSTAIDAAELGFKTFLMEDGTKAGSEKAGAVPALREQLKKGGVTVLGSEIEDNGMKGTWQEQLKEVSGLSA